MGGNEESWQRGGAVFQEKGEELPLSDVFQEEEGFEADTVFNLFNISTTHSIKIWVMSYMYHTSINKTLLTSVQKTQM